MMNALDQTRSISRHRISCLVNAAKVSYSQPSARWNLDVMYHLQLQDSLKEQEPELWIAPIFGDTGGAGKMEIVT